MNNRKIFLSSNRQFFINASELVDALADPRKNMLEQRQKKLELMGIDKTEIEDVPVTSNRSASKIVSQSSVYQTGNSSTNTPSTNASYSAQTSVKDDKGSITYPVGYQ